MSAGKPAPAARSDVPIPAGRLRRCVVKIGSALLTNEGRGLDHGAIGGWVDQIASLVRGGTSVALVSSGSIAEGMWRLGWPERPHALHELQAAAAVGQMGLVQSYESHFQRHGMHTAQILLTHEDIAERDRYLNARSTLRTLMGLGVVPVVNENDTVSTDEIRLGDNDTLGGLVANLIEADALVILTDQPGLYTADPRRSPAATLVPTARAGDPALEAMAGPGGSYGRGGMRTKLRAAALAARSGTTTVIATGREPRVLLRVAAGEALGTWLAPPQAPMAARKRWLAGQVKVSGRLVIDQGAVRVLQRHGRSLLPVGVRAVEGLFARGEIVACIDEERREVARGLVNYGAGEVRKLLGRPTSEIAARLGYVGEPELIHRDNMVLTGDERDRGS